MSRKIRQKIQAAAFIILMLWIMALLHGCADITRTAPDGSVIKYSRIGNQQISRLGIVDTPNGFQLQMEGQQALNDQFAERIAAGVVRGLMGAK
jgi:hypothetical protein